MSKGKILCIDDTPEEIIQKSQKNLKQTLGEIFNELPYGVIFEKTGQDGLSIVEKDLDIKLVLLDIVFKKQKMQGAEIADSLFKINPELKIIVLTKLEETGKKRSFGWKKNVVGYIVKKDIANPGNTMLLKNLAKAVIEDPGNKRWTLYLDTDNRTVKLQEGGQDYSFSISRSKRKWLLLEACADHIGKYIKSVDIEGFMEFEIPYPEYVNREVYEINKKVIEITQWRTWGILETARSNPSSAKLVIGNTKIDKEKIPSYTRPTKLFLTQAQFETYKKEVENRLKKLEAEIASLKKQG